MKKAFYNIIILVAVLITGVFIGSETAQAKDVDTKIISIQGDTLTVKDAQGQIYKFDKAEDDTDNYKINDKITIATEAERAPRGEKFEAIKTYTQEDGDIITEYNNGSWSLINEATKTYCFQPVELGDWDYKLESKEDLTNIIATYKSVYETGYY